MFKRPTCGANNYSQSPGRLETQFPPVPPVRVELDPGVPPEAYDLDPSFPPPGLALRIPGVTRDGRDFDHPQIEAKLNATLTRLTKFKKEVSETLQALHFQFTFPPVPLCVYICKPMQFARTRDPCRVVSGPRK